MYSERIDIEAAIRSTRATLEEAERLLQRCRLRLTDILHAVQGELFEATFVTSTSGPSEPQGEARDPRGGPEKTAARTRRILRPLKSDKEAENGDA